MIALLPRVALVALVWAALRPVLGDLPGGLWTFWGLNLALVAIAGLDAALAPRPGSLTFGRELAGQVDLGATAPIALVARNPGDRRLRLRVADELAPSLRADRRRWEVTVPARSEARMTTDIRPGRRGRFEPARVAVRVAGPLGLGARQRTVQVPGEVKVVPAFPSRRDAELRLRRARQLELGVRTVRLTGTGTDFEQLREYTPDDDFRRIDWAATARTGRPIVRTYRAERNQTLVTLVEVGRPVTGQVDGVPRLEHLLDATFALVTVATGLEDPIGVVAFDDEIRASIPPSRRAGQLARVVDGVYELECDLVETDYAAAFAHTIARYRRRTTVVIATDLTEATVTESLVPALPLVLSDQAVIIVAVRDPDVDAWSAEEVSDDADLYRRAAASAEVERRAQLAARLRSLGARVVDAPPDRLAGELVDAYLDLRWGAPR